MRIVVIEDDLFERGIAVSDLRMAFPTAEIHEFTTVGEALLCFEELRSTDVVVMEHLLPLLGNADSQEEMDATYAKIRPTFLRSCRTEVTCTTPWNSSFAT